MRRYLFIGISAIYLALAIVGILDCSVLECILGVSGAFVSGLLVKFHWKDGQV